MKKTIPIALFSLLLFSCDTTNNPTPSDPTGLDEPTVETSVNGHLTLKSSVSLPDGPHQLLINGNNLYAKRDNKLYVFSLSNPENLQEQSSYTQDAGLKFGKMLYSNNKLYVCNTDENAVYVFSSSLGFQVKYPINETGFKPNVLWIDNDNNYWIGGSNGSNGKILKCTLSGNQLNVSAQWQNTYNQSNYEWIAEKSGYLLVSNAKGEMLTFQKSDITAGAIKTLSYEAEAGHEKWGKSFVTVGNNAYWANWGAGLATVNISNPSNPTVSNVLSNSKYKQQYTGAEGTDVYDVTYNEKHNLLCVANGWSGVLLISPSAPETVTDYIDPLYFQNMCIATKGDYVYTGNISGGMSGDLKGIKVFKFK